MTVLEKLFYAILYAVIFAAAVFILVRALDTTGQMDRIVAKDITTKSSVDTLSTEKESLGITAVRDNVTKEVQYTAVKGSDVIYDIISIIDSMSEDQLNDGNLMISIKTESGVMTIRDKATLLKIKRRKAQTIKDLNEKIKNNRAEYKRVYYYDTDLDINELKYTY